MENQNPKNPLLEEQEKIIESILFMMGESVSVDTLALAIYSNENTAREAAERLVKKYEEEYSDRGMKIIRLNGKYQMVANNIYFKNLIQVASHPKKPVITEAVLETLSIIAYKQPVTKPEIEDIRGVKSDFAVNRLIEYGLIEEKGRLETPGRPIIFGTTEEFLLRFGLESTKDLPKLDPARMEQIVKEVEKEVSIDVTEPYVVEEKEINKQNVAESVTENFNKSVVDDSSATDNDEKSKYDEFEDYVNNEILIELDNEEKRINNNNLQLKHDENNEQTKYDEIREDIIQIKETLQNEEYHGYFDKVYGINESNKDNVKEWKKEKTSFIRSVINALKKLIQKILNFLKKK